MEALQHLAADLEPNTTQSRSDRPNRTVPLSFFQAVGIALLIAGASALSLHTREQGGVASVWGANGILVGALVVCAQREWIRLIALGAAALLLTRIFSGGGLDIAFSISAVNLLECGLVAGSIRYFVPDIRKPSALPLLARVATTSTILACLLSASIATLLFRTWSSQPSGTVWVTWFTAHVLGMVITATMTVTALRLKGRVLGRPGHRRDFVGCLVLLALTCAAVSLVPPAPVLFLIYVPLMLLVYRHGFAGVVAGTAVLVTAVAVGAGLELGPFQLMHGHSPLARSVLVQLFIGAACLLTFPTAVALAERQRMSSRLGAVADNMPALIAHLDRDERVTYINATGAAALGLAQRDIVGRTLREVRGGEVYAGLAAHVAAALAGQPQTFEGEAIVHGRQRDHSTRFVPDLGPDGAVRGFYALTSDITAIKRAERELQRLARFDSLTGLPNRRHLDETLEQACARAQRNGRPLMLLALDIDHFKDINDQHGHGVGDGVLRTFATRIGDCVYEVDFPARIGGDEFVVLVEYSPEAKVGAALAERILRAMREPMQIGELSLAVTASIGVGIVHPVRACEHLLEVADAALYDAKLAGRDTWRLREGSEG